MGCFFATDPCAVKCSTDERYGFLVITVMPTSGCSWMNTMAPMITPDKSWEISSVTMLSLATGTAPPSRRSKLKRLRQRVVVLSIFVVQTCANTLYFPGCGSLTQGHCYQLGSSPVVGWNIAINKPVKPPTIVGQLLIASQLLYNYQNMFFF